MKVLRLLVVALVAALIFLGYALGLYVALHEPRPQPVHQVEYWSPKTGEWFNASSTNAQRRPIA